MSPAALAVRRCDRRYLERQRGPAAEPVLIELSAAQVDQVVRAASGAGNLSVLLSGLEDVREALKAGPEQLENLRLSRSLLSGLLMLTSFPPDGSYLGNAELARMLGMNNSTTHRYCRSDHATPSRITADHAWAWRDRPIR
jgi:hypothetical protein